MKHRWFMPLRSLTVLPGILSVGLVLSGQNSCNDCDSDDDGICDDEDVCPNGDDSQDADMDSVPDACDVCPSADDGQDADADTVPDACDVCPHDNPNDANGDGICDEAPAMTLAGVPADYAVLARDTNNVAALTLVGTVSASGVDELRLEVWRDNIAYATQVFPLAGEPGDYSLDVNLEAGLFEYDFIVSADSAGDIARVVSRADIVVGDHIFVQGQSNAVAADYHSEGLANASQSRWIRSYGSATTDPTAVTTDLRWGTADGLGANAFATIGAWALRMGEILLENNQVPIALLNGSVGGTYIAQHQRNDNDPEDLNTIYGRFLYRAHLANMAASTRMMVWYQGESDGYGWGESSSAALYLEQFDALRSDWTTDFPALERIYVFQVRNGCGIDHPGDGLFTLDFRDAAGTVLQQSSLDFWSDPDWVDRTLSATAPATTAQLTVSFTPTASGEVVYDDATAMSSGGANILLNSSFESGTTSPSDWQSSGRRGYTYVKNSGHTGSRSMQLNSSSNTAQLYQSTSAIAGITYSAAIFSRRVTPDTWYDVRETLRLLPTIYEDVALMSTTAAPAHDGCHFYYDGYRELGDRIARVIARDFFASSDTTDIDPPEPLAAELVSDTEIRLTFDLDVGSLIFEAGAAMYFRVPGATVVDGYADGNTIVLRLDHANTSHTLSYTDHVADGPDVYNSRGVGIATFHDFPVASSTP